MTDLFALPDDLPVPEDDGAADHLEGLDLPQQTFAAANGDPVDLRVAAEGVLVLYVYPATGVPGQPLPDGWDQVPGARGCTPQSCAFRDHAAELAELGASIVGLSAQSVSEQREFAFREHIPYPLLNDSDFRLAKDLDLPTFDLDGRRYYRRLTLIAISGKVAKVFYPVFPPQANAAAVASWLRGHSAT
jgi:peroxiredoxin